MRKAIGIGALVAFLALAVAGLVWGSLWLGTHSAGHARYAHFTRDSSRLVILDRVRSQTATLRVRIHDARSGAELARQRMRTGWRDQDRPTRDACFDCIPASAGRLWCCDLSGDEGISLRSIDTLAEIAGEDRLHGLAPGLAQGLMQQRHAALNDTRPMVDLDDGALLVLAKDGQRYRIGADLLARVETPRLSDGREPTLHPEDLRLPPRAIRFEWNDSGLVHRAVLAQRTLALEKRDLGTRYTLTLSDRAKGAPPTPVAPHPQQTWLEAGFLADPDLRELGPVVLANPPGLVLAHVELSGAGRQLVLTRIDRDGAAGWSRALDDDRVLAARLVGDLLVVVLRDSLVGVDAATGALRWTHPL